MVGVQSSTVLQHEGGHVRCWTSTIIVWRESGLSFYVLDCVLIPISLRSLLPPPSPLPPCLHSRRPFVRLSVADRNQVRTRPPPQLRLSVAARRSSQPVARHLCVCQNRRLRRVGRLPGPWVLYSLMVEEESPHFWDDAFVDPVYLKERVRRVSHPSRVVAGRAGSLCPAERTPEQDKRAKREASPIPLHVHPLPLSLPALPASPVPLHRIPHLQSLPSNRQRPTEALGGVGRGAERSSLFPQHPLPASLYSPPTLYHHRRPLCHPSVPQLCSRLFPSRSAN